MRILVWIVRAAVFLTLFAFALNNQHGAAVKWFFGYEWQAPMVIIVLVAFGLGCAFGVLAMVPSWWRHRRAARVTPPAAPGSTAPGPSTPSSPAADVAVPATLHDGV